MRHHRRRRRRLRPDRNFDDLGNAIRKVRIDLGVTIRRGDRGGSGGRDRRRTENTARCSTSLYPGPPQRNGVLLYIKPLLYPKAQGLPIDVLQYAGRSDTFPHEPTSDQFFSESQFESYRALGEFEVTEIAGATGQLGSAVDFIDLAWLRLRE